MKNQGELENKIESLKDQIWVLKKDLYGRYYFGWLNDGEQFRHEEREPRLKELESIKGTEVDTVATAEERVRLQIEEGAYQEKITNLKSLEDELEKTLFAVCEKLAKKYHL